MNIHRAFVTGSVALFVSTAGLTDARATGGSPWGDPGPLSRAALELELSAHIDAVAPHSVQAWKARESLETFAGLLAGVRERVEALPDATTLARARLTESESQFALARLQAYGGEWGSCATSAAEALAHLEAADDLASLWHTERQSLELMLEDVEETLARARRQVVVGGFDPTASATLLHAEHARVEAVSIAAAGRLQAARWKAQGARDLAVLAIERAVRTSASLDRRARWIGPGVMAPGSGGDVR